MTPPQPNQPSEQILSLALEEARRKFERLNGDYNQLRTKMFTILGVQLAVVTFLFAVGPNNIPNIPYGIIFGSIGVAGVCVAVILLFLGVCSNSWASPAEPKELKILRHENLETFIGYLKDDYLSAYDFCRERYNKRSSLFDWSVRIFLGSVIVIMIIKFAGGQ